MKNTGGLIKLLALVLILTIFSSACLAIADTGAEYPEYLNMESTYPIIKEGYEDSIKLRVAVGIHGDTGDWDTLWIKRYLKDKYNIELEMEYVDGSAIQEKKTLYINSGDMPDIMLRMNFSTSELVKYGQEEGVLLKCEEYINETLTPGIWSYWTTDDVVKASTAPDGHVYSLPNIQDDVDLSPANLVRMFINKAWLDSNGYEMPRTLDEFVNVLYAYKEANPDSFPLGGGMHTLPAAFYILNAFGYIDGRNEYGMGPCIRDGEAVIPVYDMDVYQEYLKLMNQFYQDGIIDSSYFTIENTEVFANVNEGKNLTFAEAPYTTGMANWNEWEACYPLTSEWQPEPETYHPNRIEVGQFVISADTKYPELCMRFADIWYNNITDSSKAIYDGTGEGSEYDYGDYVMTIPKEDGSGYVFNSAKYEEGMNDWVYHLKYLVGFMPKWGDWQTRLSTKVYLEKYFGITDYPAKPNYDLSNQDHYWRQSNLNNVLPYIAQSFPSVYYVDDEVSQRIIDLTTVIEPYVKEQTALFITGQRPLTETGAFAEELKSMGIEELLSIYQDIYATQNK